MGLLPLFIIEQTIKTFKTVYLLVFYHKKNPKRVIRTKWVYRNKNDERGIVIRNKARLVDQGHTQEEGIDYDEVFAPVARIEAIRLFLAYASFKDFMVYQMDVKSTFLYRKIEEEVYVCQPLGFKDPDFPDKVHKVKKALYGLHQAPKACECKDQEKEDNVNNTNNVNDVGTNRVNALGANTKNKLPFDPEMPAFENISTFNFQVSPTPTTRIHKDHPLDQVIGDLHSATQTRNMS
nr:copia protein [Tanacetum cinerariifolium]